MLAAAAQAAAVQGSSTKAVPRTSSGFMDLLGSFLKMSRTISCTCGAGGRKDHQGRAAQRQQGQRHSRSRRRTTGFAAMPPWHQAAKNLLELLAFCPPISAHLGHAGHASHQQHLLDVCGVDPRVLHAAVAGLHRAVQQPLDQLLKLGAAGGAGQGKQEAGQGRSEWRCVGRKAGRQRGSSTSLHAGKQAIPAGPRSPRLTG